MSSPTFYVAPALERPPLTWSRLMFAALQISAIAAFAAQLLIDPTDVNMVAAFLILASSSATFQYLRWTRALAALPLSSFALIGFCLTTQWGALVAQSAAWTSVTENLRDPIRTFALLGAFQFTAIVAHELHRVFRPLKRARAFGTRALERLGVFEIPAPGCLWLMGGVGFAAFAVAAAPGEVDLGDRLLAGFWPFAWAPFLIPILHARYGEAYCNLRAHATVLAFYLLMAIGLAMALNFRLLMVQGVTTAALLVFLVTLQSEKRFDARVLWKLAPAALLGVAALGPLAYLATAMVIARADRGHLPPIELLKETVDILQDSKAIQKYRDQAKPDSRMLAYDETYIENPVVGRFVETKFHDNALYFSRDISDRDRNEIEHDVEDRTWALLPFPVLKAFNIPVDKLVLGHSMGDLYAYLRAGVPLGGLRTGSMFADLIALFEERAALVYLILCLALFLFWDALSIERPGGEVQVSVLAMLGIYRLFTYGATNESIVQVIALFIRGFWQNLAFYLLIYFFARIVFHPFAVDRRSTGASAQTPGSTTFASNATSHG